MHWMRQSRVRTLQFAYRAFYANERSSTRLIKEEFFNVAFKKMLIRLLETFAIFDHDLEK